jgi:uncharacterized protein (DUF1778 family)
MELLEDTGLAQTDMTTFILRTALREAQSVIEEHERIKLTQRDSRLVLKLLKNPPTPNPDYAYSRSTVVC